MGSSRCNTCNEFFYSSPPIVKIFSTTRLPVVNGGKHRSYVGDDRNQCITQRMLENHEDSWYTFALAVRT